MPDCDDWKLEDRKSEMAQGLDGYGVSLAKCWADAAVCFD